MLGHFAYTTGRVFRRLGFANFVGMVKRSKLFETLLFKPKTRDFTVSTEAKRALREKHRPTYQKLEALIDRSLPPAWYSDNDE